MQLRELLEEEYLYGICGRLFLNTAELHVYDSDESSIYERISDIYSYGTWNVNEICKYRHYFVKEVEFTKKRCTISIMREQIHNPTVKELFQSLEGKNRHLLDLKTWEFSEYTGINNENEPDGFYIVFHEPLSENKITYICYVK